MTPNCDSLTILLVFLVASLCPTATGRGLHRPLGGIPPAPFPLAHHVKWLALTTITRALKQTFLRTRFLCILSLDFEASDICISDEKTLIPNLVLFIIFFPEIPIVSQCDIASPSSSGLQLNENTHPALMSCMACQGENYLSHSGYIFLSSFMGLCVMAFGCHQTCPFSCLHHRLLRLRFPALAIHVRQPEQPGLSIWRGNTPKIPSI